MTERIDHAAEARKLIDHVTSVELSMELGEGVLAAAQVHATLALVEQQRIANLIAYWQLHTPRTADESGQFIEVGLIDAGDVNVDTIVREGLGLA